MTRAEASGLRWSEETITDLLLVEVPPLVKVIPFTRLQEGGDKRLKDRGVGTGADWLWWWVGEGGVSFGMLVQAKRLTKKDDGRWLIDFGYKSGKQRDDLLATADVLQVAPTYALYLGSPSYRAPVECGAGNHPSDYEQCDRCVRKTVSFYPAILADNVGIGDDPKIAYEQAIPMESLADPKAEVETPLALLWHDGLPPELRTFLTTSASSVPEAVARQLVLHVRQVRAGQFGLAVDERLAQGDEISEDFVFPSLPLDQGHLSAPYFFQILRGLKRSPPGYVLNVLNGGSPVGLDTSRLAGLVIVSAHAYG
jgi:hypothetical protein